MRSSIIIGMGFCFGLIAMSVAACGSDSKKTMDGQHEMDKSMSQMAHKPAVTQTGAVSNTGFEEMPEVGTKAKCPVTKNEFEITEASEHSMYKGKHYFFCCPGCKPKFDKNPGEFVDE